MLRPSKHSHPDRTVLRVATLVIARLRKNRVQEFAELRKYVKASVPGGDVLFLPGLNLLYLLGLVDYHPKTDAFEYRGET